MSKKEDMSEVFKKNFGSQVILIFLIPAVIMLYFAYYFISEKYKALQAGKLYTYASNNVQNFSRFIHNIQLERGMSAGYLVLQGNDEKLKNKLLKQQEKSDVAYKTFVSFVDSKSEMKKELEKLLHFKNKKLEKEVVRLYYDIPSIRREVLSRSISFTKEIEYYSLINKNLLNLMYMLLSHFEKSYGNLMDIYKLEELKEIEGLQRAYIYNYLLSGNKKLLGRIRELLVEERKYTSEFFADASIENSLLYNEMIHHDNHEKVKRFKQELMQKNRNRSNKDAQYWFEISTLRINDLEKLSIAIMQKYNKKVHEIYLEQRDALYWTVFVWVIAIFSLLFLLVLLYKLIRAQNEMLEDLRIAAYTFDSQEAVTITDPNGRIVRVNKAFSDITGYSREEAIGKNPNILKSGRHSHEFYRKMWDDLYKKGKWSGEIYNRRKNGEIYPERLSITAIKDENDITTHYIAQFIDISEIKEAEERAKFQASHDFLTKLPNRKSMIERLQEEMARAKRHGYLGAFLFLDLDGFKKINDNYGHHIGDKILIEVAKRLKDTVRSDDYIARISGDEFCVMLLDLDPNETHAAQTAKIVAEKIIENISKVFQIDGYKLFLGVSIGIKFFPDGQKDVYEIINSADAAMYKAKESGKNRYVFFNDEIDEEMRRLSVLEQEVKDALVERQFCFYIQPKVRVSDERIIGGEMLLRWRHPNRGMLYPGDFLKVVKEIGKLKEIAMMAVEQACRFLKNHGPVEGTISVNVSTYDLVSDDFIDFVVKTVLECGVEPQQIEFEILENELIEEFELVQHSLMKLKRIGIKISIDDFGTGYSSIGYLRRLSLDALKIDRYFAQDIHNETTKELVGMIIRLAHTLKLDVIVEGIETKEQLESIRTLGAEYAQGFYFGKAIEQEEFAKLLKQS